MNNKADFSRVRFGGYEQDLLRVQLKEMGIGHDLPMAVNHNWDTQEVDPSGPGLKERLFSEAKNLIKKIRTGWSVAFQGG